MAAQKKEDNGSETKQVNTDKTETKPDNVDTQEIDPLEQTDAVDGSEEPENLEAKLEASEVATKEAHDRFLRVSADFENFKKRSAREMADFRKYANESLIRELLPVVDNLERAIASAIDNGDSNSFLEGVDLTLKEILKVFDKFVVKPIEAVGKPFDPTFHQAVMQEETDDKPENTILGELQKGYTIHDRLLRPTMVVVSKAISEEEGRDNPDPRQEYNKE
jgi:molecular chaperone GrpE